jgi:mono/diheme cytochrome c family protein
MRRILTTLLAAGLGLLAAAPAQDGRELFLRHCATCHGEAGRGDGPTRVEPRPRDLSSGKFSFGTTRDALGRTVRGGIAPAMPAFGELLRDEEIGRVVEYVRSLMPQVLEASPTESRIRVGDRPRIARGHLPPREAGGPPLPRGLVLGLPNGLVLEYRTDDFRLLRTFVVAADDAGAAFVDRADWRGRGGAPLELLGSPLDPVAGGDFGPAQLTGTDVDLQMRLEDTWIDGDRVRFAGELRDGERALARFTETLGAVSLGGGIGFHRRTEFHGATAERSLRLTTAGLLLANTRRAERGTVRGLEIWYVGSSRDGTVEALGVRGPTASKATIRGGAGKVLVPIGDRPFTRVDVLRLRLPAFEIERLADYAEGFDR